MAEQARFNMLLFERLTKKNVIMQINLNCRQIVCGAHVLTYGVQSWFHVYNNNIFPYFSSFVFNFMKLNFHWKFNFLYIGFVVVRNPPHPWLSRLH